MLSFNLSLPYVKKTPVGSTSKVVGNRPLLSTSPIILIQTLSSLTRSGAGASSLVSLPPPSSPQPVSRVAYRRDLFKGKALQQLSMASEQKSSRSTQQVWFCFLCDRPSPSSTSCALFQPHGPPWGFLEHARHDPILGPLTWLCPPV